ncbi:TSUP family transporter [Eionea flava]
MIGLEWYEYALIGLLFIWSGIVRSGFGFGGAVFALPFLLIIDNQPLVFLPIIAVHLLVFSSLTVYQNHRKKQPEISESGGSVNNNVDWRYLKKALGIMIIPKMIGVFGLLTLPPKIMSVIIFGIITIYAFSYVFNKPFQSNHKVLDVVFLMLGGYISGTSLIGAPLIVAVFVKNIAKAQLRDTLFVLWFILVVIKMASFIYYGVDLQLEHHLWLLPCAAVGHVIGLRLHEYLLSTDSVKFYRVFGVLLLFTSIGGIAKEWFVG